MAQWRPMKTNIKKKPQLPDIPEEEQTPLVKGLLALLEQFAVRIQEQDEEIARLKDEVSILKGEKKRPKFKGSKLDSETDCEAEVDADSSGTPKKRAGSRKNAKTSQLTIHEEKLLTPEEPVPEGSRFKGYRNFVVQDLIIQAHNTRYRQERWITPTGDTLVGALPSSLRSRHFGQQLVSYILYQHHHCQTTQPLLLEQLREWGIDISSGQINQLLVCDQKAFHEEKDDLLQAGLAVSSYVTVDDSGARHQGRNAYVTQIGNDFFAWFRSTNSKSRVNLLGSVLNHGLCDDLAIVSDDAGQFNVLSHGLCWVHAERLIHKLLPLNEAHREDIARVRGEIWDLYTDLKSYKHQPDAAQSESLSLRFDAVFTQRTRYATLNRTLRGIHSNKAKLLLVLERPEIPLHTNRSETDIRDYVKKRKVSGGTRSDEGRRCRDTFASLKKTCRNLDISFWQYIRDRLGIGEVTIHRLPDIVRERAAAPAY